MNGIDYVVRCFSHYTHQKHVYFDLNKKDAMRYRKKLLDDPMYSDIVLEKHTTTTTVEEIVPE